MVGVIVSLADVRSSKMIPVRESPSADDEDEVVELERPSPMSLRHIKLVGVLTKLGPKYRVAALAKTKGWWWYALTRIEGGSVRRNRNEAEMRWGGGCVGAGRAPME